MYYTACILYIHVLHIIMYVHVVGHCLATIVWSLPSNYTNTCCGHCLATRNMKLIRDEASGLGVENELSNSSSPKMEGQFFSTLHPMMFCLAAIMCTCMYRH